MPSCLPHPPLLGPHCFPGISQDWSPAPQFPHSSHMVSPARDPVFPVRHPTAPLLLFRGHRFDPNLLPVWVMSLFLDNLGELEGQADHESGGVLGLWGALGGGDALSRPGPGSGPGQAASAWVREQGRIFFFHFPPTESTGRELAVCPGGREAPVEAMSSFPQPRDPSTCGLGAQLWPDITHLLPTLLLGVLSQALHPQTPALSPSRYQGYPKGPRGWKGSVGQRGRGTAGKRNHPTVAGGRGFPHQPPASPTPKTPPRSPE